MQQSIPLDSNNTFGIPIRIVSPTSGQNVISSIALRVAALTRATWSSGRLAAHVVSYPMLCAILGITSDQVYAQPISPNGRFAIAIHGGAGDELDNITQAERTAHRKSLAAALDVGRKILAEGGKAIDAVEQTIRVLEDDPLFNAGRGAVFNAAGTHELDASVMDGSTGQGGAVAGVTTVKNPISLARLVMTETPHVLLMGAGAEKFADEMRDRKQIERVKNSYFSTELRRLELEQEKKKQAEKPHRGTVGCVVCDKHGNLAAGTSTGGLTNKMMGRVGDSPILGAGTYANNDTCAVSCTGTGEYYIRNSIAFHVSALMAYKGLSLDDATGHVIEKVLPNDIGGLIAVDRHGHISTRFNTSGMARASIDTSGKEVIELGK
jgi:L-asparaginase / beta-aspartyl-peptidase